MAMKTTSDEALTNESTYRFSTIIFKVRSSNPLNCWLQRAGNTSMQKGLQIQTSSEHEV